ncbi:hypothetical protein [Methanoregula sp.]|uniref:hypothetical protein n=1 Tax=Methanoregula sp. TaxID=2052170 RepID=UPI0023705F30|nr:hypothetical protein [Methanoregula sp.]MDD1685484.1 hypothetical protein [Methanoregula sp.]
MQKKVLILTIILISIIVVLGIAGGFSLYGILFPAKDLPSVHSSSPGDHLVQGQKIIDTNFEIQEWNLSKVHKMNMTMILLNRDDFADFPEFARSMQGVNNDPAAWNYGSRVVTWFQGNESDLYRFYDAACKNKTRAECFPSSPSSNIMDSITRSFLTGWDRTGLPAANRETTTVQGDDVNPVPNIQDR